MTGSSHGSSSPQRLFSPALGLINQRGRLVSRIALGALAALMAMSGSAPAGDLAQLKAAYKRPLEVPFPPYNPYTLEKASLGKALFFDPRLSGVGNINCASCHNPSFGWEVPVETAVGAANVHLGRQAPTVLNAAWRKPFFWDGRAATAEEQAKGPIQAPPEMNLPLPEAVKRLEAIPAYDSAFKKAFPDQGVTEDTIVAAIATFERTVVASYAPFDRWIDGDENGISESAKRGFTLFTGKAMCAECHTGWEFTDNKFHDIGTTVTDIGRAQIDPNDPFGMYAFKTPSLRDTAQRAPYMHSGKFATLRDVVNHYLTGGIDRPSRSPQLASISLNDQEVDDLIAFMATLTGEKQVVTLPVLPN
jgi:cytochrome c peroxidase